MVIDAGIFPTKARTMSRICATGPAKLRADTTPLSCLLRAPDSSEALGFGFRAVSGLLHHGDHQERLEREKYQLDLITTPPASSTKSARSTGR